MRKNFVLVALFIIAACNVEPVKKTSEAFFDYPGQSTEVIEVIADLTSTVSDEMKTRYIKV